MNIKNVVFDVGNVLVKWEPLSIVKTFFPDHPQTDLLVQVIFRCQIWLDLNLGRIHEAEALKQYQTLLRITPEKAHSLGQVIRESLTPMTDSIALLKELKKNPQIKLYCLTDNINEIVTDLKRKYDFWQAFEGIVVSAEVGYLKPCPAIYQHLLSTYQLVPNETVFIDDAPQNIWGAESCGIKGVHFQNIEQCRADLRKFNVPVS